MAVVKQTISLSEIDDEEREGALEASVKRIRRELKDRFPKKDGYQHNVKRNPADAGLAFRVEVEIQRGHSDGVIVICQSADLSEALLAVEPWSKLKGWLVLGIIAGLGALGALIPFLLAEPSPTWSFMGALAGIA